MARHATLRILGVVVWGCFGAAGGFMALEVVGWWVLDPVVVILLWRICQRSSNRDQFLAVYAIGYLAVTAHYLVPHLYAAAPSLADRIYFSVLLLAGAILLVASTWHLTASRLHRPRPPVHA
ncbi:MAG TPA: hypothetical protein VMW80_09505 [Candidatus Dormibacteraeota bacterium]|nr:hypothetical protein [Candidatus Dormibacteraeota bacterium]